MKTSHPPKLAANLLRQCYGKAISEDLLGDLDELYYTRQQRSGSFKARWFYWYQVIRLCLSYTLVKRKRDASLSPLSTQNRSTTMFYNYLKISYRNILKNRTFTILNVFGLALGMSVALLALAMFLELQQFDAFHPYAQNTYRITTELNHNGNLRAYASAPAALADLCDEQIPGIQQSVRINDYFFPKVKTTGDPIELSGYITEPAFFELFEFPLAEGNPEVLLHPGQVILNHELAQKLFGNKPALGQVMDTENWGILQVAGVMEPFPKHTHLTFDLLAGYPNLDKVVSTHKQWTDFQSNYFYFHTDEPADKMMDMVNQLGTNGHSFFAEDHQQVTYELQALSDINPGPDLADRIGLVFDRPTMFLFFGLALLILIPASLNYVNMAIANALKRSKEIGIRKVMGSQASQIIKQFLVETVLICLLSLGLSSLIFMAIRQEYLSMLIGASALSLIPNWTTILVFVFFGIVTGVITGLVPALFFSKTSPVEAIRKAMDNKKVSISGIRKGLMVFQFMLSLVLMIGIGVLVRQYQHSLTYNLGFSKENILVIPTAPEGNQLFINEIQGLSEVKNTSLSSSIPGTTLNRSTYFFSEDGLDSIRAREVFVDDQFMMHMDLKMAWGNSQMNNNQIDQVIINETLMDLLGNFTGNQSDSLRVSLGQQEKVQIIGVVQDYNHEPLRERIEPMVIRHAPNKTTYALVSIATADLPQTLTNLEDRWDRVYPNTPFRSSFLNEEIERTYDFFRTALKLFGFLAILAITISCLGLLGMVIYATENRTKEVAIRKIMGANAMDLMKVLAGLFFRLWVIALMISIPASYFFYDQLFVRIYNKFSNGVGVLEIFLSSVVTVSLGALAILWQTRKVLKTNPAVNLRNE